MLSMKAFSRIHAYICHENLYLAFNQINYENAADTRICILLTSFWEIFALAAVRSKAVVLLPFVDSLLSVTPIVGFCNFLCFVVRYFVSILVLQSFRLGRESWLLCFVCLPGVS